MTSPWVGPHRRRRQRPRSPTKPVLMPSSFGLSFAVAPGCDRLAVSVSLGRYIRKRGVDDGGMRSGIWQREPIAAELLVTVPPVTGRSPSCRSRRAPR